MHLRCFLTTLILIRYFIFRNYSLENVDKISVFQGLSFQRIIYTKPRLQALSFGGNQTTSWFVGDAVIRSCCQASPNSWIMKGCSPYAGFGMFWRWKGSWDQWQQSIPHHSQVNPVNYPSSSPTKTNTLSHKRSFERKYGLEFRYGRRTCTSIWRPLITRGGILKSLNIYTYTCINLRRSVKFIGTELPGGILWNQGTNSFSKFGFTKSSIR